MRKIISILMIAIILIATIVALPVQAEEVPTDTPTEDSSNADTPATDTPAAEVDFSELEALLEKVDSLNKKDWHSRLFLYLTMAADEGRAMLEKEGITQADVNRIAREIQRKYDDLEERPTPIPLDEMTMEEYEAWLDGEGALYENSGEKHTMRPKETAPIPANLVPITEDANGEDGCSGLIGGAALVAVSVVAIGFGVALKKKED